MYTWCVDDQIKLTRLLQYTSGPAKSAIKTCALVGGSSGYQQAHSILKARFGNDHLVSQSIISQLKSDKTVVRSTDMQQLADELSMASVALSKLSMCGEVDNQRTILDILQRCPQHIRAKWRQKALDYKGATGSYPNFEVFVHFVNQSAMDACDPLYGVDSFRGNARALTPTRGANFSTVTQGYVSDMVLNNGSPKGPCVVCSGPHRLFSCDVFKSMQPKDRFAVVQNNQLCFNCLMSGHRASRCRKLSVCSVPGCGKRHTKFIHVDSVRSGVTCHSPHASGHNDVWYPDVTRGPGNMRRNDMNVVSSANDVSDTSVQLGQNNVYLPIVSVNVNGTLRVNALLDTGSTNTFMSSSLANQLQLSGTMTSNNLSTLTSKSVANSKVVSVQLSPVEGGKPVTLNNVLVVTDTPMRCPNLQVEVLNYPHLSDLPLCTPESKGAVDILIGMDNAQLLMPLEVRRSESQVKEPYAVRSYFGWSLRGSTGGPPGEVYAHFVNLF